MTIMALSLNPVLAFVLGLGSRLTRKADLSAALSSPATWLATVGYALLILPQLILDGFTGDSLWLAASGLAMLTAVLLASGRPEVDYGGLGWPTLLASAVILAGPALWRLLFESDALLWWTVHGNIWASFACMVAFASIPLYRGPVRLPALGVMALAAICVTAATGSRTALLACLVGVVAVLILGGSRWSWTTVTVVIGLIVAGSLLVLWGPLSTRLAGLAGESSSNALMASEDLESDYWTKRGVVIERVSNGSPYAWFRIRSESGDPLNRAHQRVYLPPGAVRTFTVESPAQGSAAGILSFAEGGGRIFVPLDPNARTEASGLPALHGVVRDQLEDGWLSLSVTVVNESNEPLVWRVGVAPHYAPGGAEEVLVRHLRLSHDASVRPYSPSYEATRVQELARLSASQRVRYGRGVVALFARSPWLGYGTSAPFHELLDRVNPPASSGSDKPVHAHSLIGDFLVRSGLIGLAGIVLLTVGLVTSLAPGRRKAVLPLILVVLVLGVGDATFLPAAGPFVLAVLRLSLP